MTILCADANMITLHGLKRKVKRLLPDADIFTCRNKEEAIGLVRSKGCDILITEIDFGREKEEGIILAEEIKELYPQVNIIFTTAGFERNYTHRIMRLHISGFIMKPFGLNELRDELWNLRY